MTNLLSKTSEFLKVNYLQLIFLISLISVLGSLYFSEFLHLEPCSLCWYQRIFMYPMCFISLLAILKKDESKNLPVYLFGLALPGTLIALYHWVLQTTTAAGSNLLEPCSIGKDCSQIDVTYLGFITIPLLSLLAFVTILVLLLNLYLHQRKSR